MKKMRLDLDTLSIESFDTTQIDATQRGTVKGHLPPDTYWRYCSDGLTCAAGGESSSTSAVSPLTPQGAAALRTDLRFDPAPVSSRWAACQTVTPCAHTKACSRP